jgi:hypothetical protein
MPIPDVPPLVAVLRDAAPLTADVGEWGPVTVPRGLLWEAAAVIERLAEVAQKAGLPWSQAEWYAEGVAQGYCSELVCDTHDGLPMSGEEAEAWDAGDPGCMFVVRLFELGAIAGE